MMPLTYIDRGIANYYLGRTLEAKKDFQAVLELPGRTGDAVHEIMKTMSQAWIDTIRISENLSEK